MIHSTNVSGLTDWNSYTYYVRCIDTTSNENTSDYTINFNVDNATPPPPVDTVAPVLSNWVPSWIQPAWTTNLNITLNTDENATCKYSSTPWITYASMVNTFSTTWGNSHSTNVSGLTDWNSYTYYVRCIDSSSNVNTSDFAISFNIDNATPPPIDTTPPILSNWLPVWTRAAWTNNVNLSLTSNENASCKYSNTSWISYSSMVNNFSTTGGSSHTTNVSWLSNGNSYTYYVKCIDSSSNENLSDYTISFNIDTAPASDTFPPVLSNWLPSWTRPTWTTNLNITLNSDENATCRYSNSSWTQYSSMIYTFSTTGGSSHSTNISGLTNWNSYSYYIRCIDSYSNENTSDFTISFNIDNTIPPPVDTIPPVLSNWIPNWTQPIWTTNLNISLSTDENSTCRYSSTPWTLYSSMINNFSTTWWSFHSTNISGLSDGNSYSYYIRCIDSSSNENTSDYGINFDIDNPVTDPNSYVDIGWWVMKIAKVIVDYDAAPIYPQSSSCPANYSEFWIYSNIVSLITVEMPFSDGLNTMNVRNDFIPNWWWTNYYKKIISINWKDTWQVTYKTVNPDADYLWTFTICIED